MATTITDEKAADNQTSHVNTMLVTPDGLDDALALKNEVARTERELHNNQQPLLQLPAELRNQIYDEIYPDSYTWELVSLDDHCQTDRDFPNPTNHFALLRICRLLRMEATPLIYARTHFRLIIDGPHQGPSRLLFTDSWLQNLDPHSLASLRNISVSKAVWREETDRRPGTPLIEILRVSVHGDAREVTGKAPWRTWFWEFTSPGKGGEALYRVRYGSGRKRLEIVVLIEILREMARDSGEEALVTSEGLVAICGLLDGIKGFWDGW